MTDTKHPHFSSPNSHKYKTTPSLSLSHSFITVLLSECDYHDPRSSFLTTCCLTHTLTTLLLHTYHYTSVRLFVHTYSPIKVTPAHSLWSSCLFLVTSILLHTYWDTSVLHHVLPCHLLFHHVPCYSSTSPVTCAHSHTCCFLNHKPETLHPNFLRKKNTLLFWTLNPDP